MIWSKICCAIELYAIVVFEIWLILLGVSVFHLMVGSLGLWHNVADWIENIIAEIECIFESIELLSF